MVILRSQLLVGVGFGSVSDSVEVCRMLVELPLEVSRHAHWNDIGHLLRHQIGNVLLHIAMESCLVSVDDLLDIGRCSFELGLSAGGHRKRVGLDAVIQVRGSGIGCTMRQMKMR